MKTFKELKSLLEAPGAPAADNTLEKDDDQEVKGYKPRSKGEEKFANQHMVTKMSHPVATDAQFTGDIPKGDPEGHVGGKKHAKGNGCDGYYLPSAIIWCGEIDINNSAHARRSHGPCHNILYGAPMYTSIIQEFHNYNIYCYAFIMLIVLYDITVWYR